MSFKLLANKDWSFLYALSGVGGSITTYAFGGWSGVLELLFIFFAIDYITGCAASLKEKRGLQSIVGFWGLLKKGLVLLMVFLGHRIDLAMGTNFTMSGVIWFWLANELVSIVENYGRIGIRVPHVLRKVITTLQDGEGRNEK
ncbi:phage holin family protein [Cohnella herbarum]|uniref:Phage holin family protein n=1 Tax=Cohnella herbarum TaxID=2728023 RepID=A0A7Z2ZQ46_9BACL|nr:phage holin family protein [Cohnella herbarum]